ncbi:hypothetical protein VPH35_088667 [Triticum aestivum]|uniref:uncharacterized protein n=1 Tax=Triticum aestivum TaxID=4565 RepID=UPI001D0241C0|nr:uncharacterized protein LOC123110718 [Triticum aestivum]
MAEPFPTSDPRDLRIIAHVLYGLPRLPGGGGGAVRDREARRPGGAVEGRGDAPLGSDHGVTGDAVTSSIPSVPEAARGPDLEGLAGRGAGKGLPSEARRRGRVEGRGAEPLGSDHGVTGEAVTSSAPSVPEAARGPDLEGLAGRGAAKGLPSEARRRGRVEGRGAAPLVSDHGVTGEAVTSSAPLVSEAARGDDLEGIAGQGAGVGEDFSCSSMRGPGPQEEAAAPTARVSLDPGSCSQEELGGGEDLVSQNLVHDLTLVSTNNVTAALSKTNSPVSHFRIDSILFVTEQLDDWFKLLVTKKVKEVVVVNRRWPKTVVDFPINGLDNTGVQQLSICFCKIPDALVYDMDTLLVLDLSHCYISKETLHDMVYRCKKLREIHLGYHKESILVSSGTLQLIQLWFSQMDLIEVRAPLLQKITVSAVPKGKDKLRVRLQGCSQLHTLVGNISAQAILIEGHDIRMGTKLMTTLKNLHIVVSLSKEKERKHLLNIFKYFPYLEKLTLWRMDDVSSDEAVEAAIDDWADELRALEIMRHLRLLQFQGFKGGDFEVCIAEAFLKLSTSLRDLVIESDMEDTFERAKSAFKPPSQVNISYQKSSVAALE